MRSADANVDPFALFSDWLLAARRSGSLSNPAAFCLSTLNERGQPDARMLDLKEFSSAGFVFGTHVDSPKARAISANANVALTFWWDHIGRQVRSGKRSRSTNAKPMPGSRSAPATRSSRHGRRGRVTRSTIRRSSRRACLPSGSDSMGNRSPAPIAGAAIEWSLPAWSS